MLVATRSSIWTGAATQLDPAPVEVVFELSPFGLGDRAILVAGPDSSAPVEEFLVVPDDIFVEHGNIRLF